MSSPWLSGGALLYSGTNQNPNLVIVIKTLQDPYRARISTYDTSTCIRRSYQTVICADSGAGRRRLFALRRRRRAETGLKIRNSCKNNRGLSSGDRGQSAGLLHTVVAARYIASPSHYCTYVAFIVRFNLVVISKTVRTLPVLRPRFVAVYNPGNINLTPAHTHS